jgi:hypothetical protein
MLLARMVDEARRYHLTEMTLHGFDQMAELERIAQSGNISVIAGTSPVLRFEAQAIPMVASPPSAMIASYA